MYETVENDAFLGCQNSMEFLKEFEISEFSPEELEIVDKSMFQDESFAFVHFAN